MNSEFPTDPRQALEASLTAMLLGELPADQVEFLQRAIAQDAELARMHARLLRAIGFIREVEAPTPVAEPAAAEPVQLSAARRDQLLQHFKTVPLKKAPSRPRPRFRPVLVAVAATVLILGFVALLLPSLSRAKSRGMHSWALSDAGVSTAVPDSEAQRVFGDRLDQLQSKVTDANADIALGAPAKPEIVLPGVQATTERLVNGESLNAVLPSDSAANRVVARTPETRLAFAYDASGDIEKKVDVGQAELSRSRLQEGLRNGMEVAEKRLLPPAAAAPPAISGKPLEESSVRMQARYGLAGSTALPPAPAKGKEVQSHSAAADLAGTPMGVPAQETAVNEAVTRQSAEIARRQRLADISGAEARAKQMAGRAQVLAEGDESARVPILGDKPLLGRAYREQPKLGTEFKRDSGIKSELAVENTAVMGFFSKESRDALAKHKTLSEEKEVLRELNRKSGQEQKFAGNEKDADSRGRLVNVEQGSAVTSNLKGFYSDLPADSAGKGPEPANAPVSSRELKVDPNAFIQGIDSVKKFDLSSVKDSDQLGGAARYGGGGHGGGVLTTPHVNVAGGLGGGAGGLPYRADAITRLFQTNKPSDLEAKARQYFGAMGIDLTPPHALFWNDREGKLVVRASPQELDTVQSALGILDSGVTLVASNGTPHSSTEPKLGQLAIESGITNPAKAKLASKLNDIRLDSVAFDGLPLTDVIKILNDEAKRRDPEQRGINFLVNPNTDSGRTTGVAIDPATGLPLAGREQVELSQVLVKILPPLRDVRLSDVLDAIVKVADAPIQVSLEDYAVVFSPRARNSGDLAELKIDLGQLQTSTATNQQSDVSAPKPPTPPPIPQPEIDTRENAFSTFSLNVSDVSFKLAAASLEKGTMPEPASIRSEEFINAFDYRDPEAPAGVPLAFAWDRSQYPFAQNRDLLRFSLKTAARGREAGRPLNLVILLDNSGSMERADRVQIIREALHVLAAQLQPQDKLSLITFARTAQLRADGVAGNQATNVADEVSGLTPEGGTNLEQAMNLAYETARKHYLANGVNRVVLLTDGAANLGEVEPENLKKKVEAQRKQGIALDCFGIGWEGYNDDLLEVLSRNGDGRYGFINTPEEALTEFAAQLAGALHVAASDVKVQVEFNPKRVSAWRQIGYAKHQLTKEQFRDNTVDAAEIGAAESGNALYVVEVNPAGQGPVATVRARYKVPGTADYHEHEWTVPYSGNAAALEQASPAIRLAAVASGFSEWLATSPYAAEITTDSLLNYLRGIPEVYSLDPRPQKLEWMIRQAKSLSGK